MRQVVEALIRGIGVDRRHQPVPDADAVVQHLGERGQAVGGAGGVRDDVVRVAVVGVVEVDAERNRHVGIRGGCRDDHLAGAGLEVLGGALAIGEETG